MRRLIRRRDGTLADQGTYVALWQWRVDRWQIRYEVWRSSWLVSRYRQGVAVSRSATR